MTAIDILDEMIAEEARIACKIAAEFPQDFERLNMSTGSGIRLQALQDAKRRIIRHELRDLEQAAKLET